VIKEKMSTADNHKIIFSEKTFPGRHRFPSGKAKQSREDESSAQNSRKPAYRRKNSGLPLEHRLMIALPAGYVSDNDINVWTLPPHFKC